MAQPQTPPATPQAAPTVKPGTVKKFIFPFPGPDTAEGTPTEIPSALYTKTWGQYAMDGFYPLGLSGQWHGGIHFDDNTGGQFNQTFGVRCIADGEVIAWRYNEQPLVSEYDEGKGKYSTGFVLVRHLLEYPRERLDNPEDGSFDCFFYSLYMHLLHPVAYVPNPNALESDGPSPARPDIWVNETDRLRRVVGKRARDKRPAWSIPATVSTKDRGKLLNEVGVNFTRQGITVAWAGPGARLTLKPGEGATRELLVVENAEAWYTDPAAGVVAPVGLQVLETSLDKVPGLPQTGAVHILPEPLPVEAGALIGHLGDYQRFGEVAIRDHRRRLLHLEVFAGPKLKGFIEQCRALDSHPGDKHKNLLVIDVGAQTRHPSPPDLTIKAGEWLKLDPKSPKEGDWVWVQCGTNSYSGTDERRRQAGFTRPASGGNAWVERHSFMGNARNGLWKLDSDLNHAWNMFPLSSRCPPATIREDATVAVRAVINLKQKKDDPPPRVLKSAADAHGVRCWYVQYIALKGKNLTWSEGWVTTETEKVKLCSPWAWPGFELVEEDTSSPLDWFNLRKTNRYGSNSPILEKLLAFIDTNRDGRLTLKELRDGWAKFWLAQQLSRLIIEHKSEWGLEMSFWDEVGEAIKAAARRPENQRLLDFVKIWDEERKRIEKLRFWDDVKGKHGFPEDIKVWHIHPLGLVENFYSSKRHPVILVDGQKVELEFLDFNDGEPIPEDEYTNAAASIGCEVAVIKAFARVESGSIGPFFNFNGWDRVPTILFERHKFHQFTNGAYSTEENRNISHSTLANRSLAYPNVDGYWRSEYQYQRLLKAYALDKRAALLAASWGRFQLMGFNHATIPGVSSVEDMVIKFSQSEKWHFRGLVGFVNNNTTLRNALRNKNWTTAALSYNGANALSPPNLYHKKLEEAYNAIQANN